MKTILMTAFVAAALTAAAPAVGVWTLNVAKSKGLTTVPKSQVVTTTQEGDTLTQETRVVAADGTESSRKVVLIRDGKEHPITSSGGGVPGMPRYDSYVSRDTGGHTSMSEFKKGGKVLRTVHVTYSKDGKTRTVAAKGVDEQGKAYETLSVYERQ